MTQDLPRGGDDHPFRAPASRLDLPAVEQEILEIWRSRMVEERSLRGERGAGAATQEDAPHYVFYDGPPFATGLPHYGHLLAGTIKDVVPRYWFMRGYQVERRFGWDCHGL
ncbi:MAG: class I tRNA ligase family protein, partial [Myxococcales bacterium]|nr:class I tRNA ligase family protein [Myxococcales bacterium]